MQHQILLKAIIIMVCGGALLCIAQLWTSLLAWDIFFKVLITLGILVVLAAFGLVAKADLGTHKKMKDENYLD